MQRCLLCDRPAAFLCRHAGAERPEPFCSDLCSELLCGAGSRCLAAASIGPKIRKGARARSREEKERRARLSGLRAREEAYLSEFLSRDSICEGGRTLDMRERWIYAAYYYGNETRWFEFFESYFGGLRFGGPPRPYRPAFPKGHIEVTVEAGPSGRLRGDRPQPARLASVADRRPDFAREMADMDAEPATAPDVVVRYVGLRLVDGEGASSGHANIVVINRVRREIYYFEPHGSGAPWNEAAEAGVRDLLSRAVPGYSFVRTAQFCPKTSWQTAEQSAEGLCAMWSAMFAFWRIQLSAMSSAAIVERVMAELSRSAEDAARVANNFVCMVWRAAHGYDAESFAAYYDKQKRDYEEYGSEDEDEIDQAEEDRRVRIAALLLEATPERRQEALARMDPKRRRSVLRYMAMANGEDVSE